MKSFVCSNRKQSLDLYPVFLIDVCLLVGMSVLTLVSLLARWRSVVENLIYRRADVRLPVAESAIDYSAEVNLVKVDDHLVDHLGVVQNRSDSLNKIQCKFNQLRAVRSHTFSGVIWSINKLNSTLHDSSVMVFPQERGSIHSILYIYTYLSQM